MRAALIIGLVCATSACRTSPTNAGSSNHNKCAQSGSGASKPSSCLHESNGVYGQFCCHDHVYESPYRPGQQKAYADYHYEDPIVLSSIRVQQHANGVNCLRAVLDGRDLGTSCLTPIKRGGSQYREHEISHFSGFDSTISGKDLKVYVTDTPNGGGYAVYAIQPQVGCGQSPPTGSDIIKLKAELEALISGENAKLKADIIKLQADLKALQDENKKLKVVNDGAGTCTVQCKNPQGIPSKATLTLRDT